MRFSRATRLSLCLFMENSCSIWSDLRSREKVLGLPCNGRGEREKCELKLMMKRIDLRNFS